MKLEIILFFFNFVTVKINRDKRKGITSDINRPKFAKKMTRQKNGRLISDQYGCQLSYTYIFQQYFCIILRKRTLKRNLRKGNVIFLNINMFHHQKHDEAAEDYDG